MGKYSTRMEINGVEDVPVTVHYEQCRFIPGARDGNKGLKIEPDEPAHIEIQSVVLDEDNRTIELTQKDERRLEEEIGEWLNGAYDPPEPPEHDGSWPGSDE